MTLTKNKMVREIGQRTRLKNRDVQLMLEALVEVWVDGLAAGKRIELENFLVLEIKEIDRGDQAGKLTIGGAISPAPRHIRRLVVRASKSLKQRLNV